MAHSSATERGQHLAEVVDDLHAGVRLGPGQLVAGGVGPADEEAVGTHLDGQREVELGDVADDEEPAPLDAVLSEDGREDIVVLLLAQMDHPTEVAEVRVLRNARRLVGDLELLREPADQRRDPVRHLRRDLLETLGDLLRVGVCHDEESGPCSTQGLPDLDRLFADPDAALQVVSLVEVVERLAELVDRLVGVQLAQEHLRRHLHPYVHVDVRGSDDPPADHPPVGAGVGPCGREELREALLNPRTVEAEVRREVVEVGLAKGRLPLLGRDDTRAVPVEDHHPLRRCALLKWKCHDISSSLELFTLGTISDTRRPMLL